MIPVELLWAVLVLAAVAVGAVYVIQQRRVEDTRVALNRTRKQLAFDEELLAELRGPRHAPDPDDWRRA